jgi:hypothetical protein
MAKNKRATALFEVMSKAKLPNKPGSGFSTPKWWFRSTNRSEVRTLAPGQSTAGAIPPAAAPAEPALAPVADDIHDDTDDHRSADDPTQVDPATLRMPRAQRDRERDRERERERSAAHSLASSIDVPESSPTAPGPRVQPVEVSVDPKTQQISLRLSYTSALIGGFAFLILIALAILIGKTLSRGPSPAIANANTKTLRQNPPTPGVMQVQRRTTEQSAGGSNEPGETAGQGARPTPGGSTGTRTVPKPGYVDPQPPATFFTDDPKRSQGLNYAIVQSFPNKESAQKAADFLTTHGVPCTIERDLPRWPLPWKEGCAVVGIRGFGKTRDNPELEAYKKTIQELGVKFAGGKARFNAFDPRMYQWDKVN